MKRSMWYIAACLLTGMVFPTLTLGATGSVMIPAGSALHVRLTTTLTSKTNKSGDTFTGMVSQPIVVDGQEVVPSGSTVEGHVAFVKPSGRIKGKAEMRIVLDSILTPDDVKFPMSAGIQDTHSGPCAQAGSDNEGTIKGCGKSKKTAAKDAAIGAGVGAAGGLMVGLETRGGCSYYGCWPGSGPGVGTDVMYGAGIGAGTALIYNLFRHEKDIILVQGTELVFVVNRSADAAAAAPQTAATSTP
jgi:hypothetical protein